MSAVGLLPNQAEQLGTKSETESEKRKPEAASLQIPSWRNCAVAVPAQSLLKQGSPARMQNLADVGQESAILHARVFLLRNHPPDEPFGFQDKKSERFPANVITSGEQRRPLLRQQFVRRPIAPAFSQNGSGQ